MMKTAKKIRLQPAMNSDAARKVMAALQTDVQPGAAYFVGGCVRDAILELGVEDVDIATVFVPEKVVELLEVSGIKAIPTGIEHGTITAVIDDQCFEITTLRKDVQTFGRHADVEFSSDYLEDAKRRDFTINTLLTDLEGHIYDPLDCGLNDLNEGRVRFVGDPDLRIKEDYLRILRFFRFYDRYENGDPDQDALIACKANANQLASLSKERIGQEFFKILSGDNCVDIIKLMFSCNVLNGLSDSAYNDSALNKLVSLQKEFELHDCLARLLMISRDQDKFDEFFVLSVKQKKHIKAMSEVLDGHDVFDLQQAKKMIYLYEQNAALQAFLIMMSLGETNIDIRELLHWQAPEFPLRGNDLIKAGVLEGPELGKTLSEIEQWWLDQGMLPDRQSCLEKLNQNLN